MIFHTAGEAVFRPPKICQDAAGRPADVRNTGNGRPGLRARCGRGSISSSVDGTVIWMKSFHVTVSEGMGDPVRRSVSGHPPRRGIFRGEICGMSNSGGAPQACPQTTNNEQIRPATRPWILLSKPLSSSHPPSLRHAQCDLPLSSLSLYLCLRNVHVCLFVVQTRV
jgi:hypothetical protein